MICSPDRCGWASLLLLILLAPWQQLCAQKAEPSPANQPPHSFTLQKNVRSVVVDVTALDSRGKPIPGLKAKDFSVAEDKVPQRILSFEAHDMDAWTEVAPPNLPPDTFVNLPKKPERGPVYVLFYDMADTDLDTQMFERHQLVKFMESKPQGTVFCVMAVSDGLHLIQGFTSDRKKLLAAFDLYGKTPHMPMVFLYRWTYLKFEDPFLNYLEILESIRQYLRGVPGRKNLIWVSGAFPVLLTPGPIQDLLPKHLAPWPPEIEPFLKEFAAMAADRIAIYPIAQAFHRPLSSEDEMAKLTGGRELNSTVDIAGSLATATEDGGDYYTLSYTSTNRDYDNRLRGIKITLPKMKKGSYELAYRRQYVAYDGGTSRELGFNLGLHAGAIVEPQERQNDDPPQQPGKPSNQPPDTLHFYMRHGYPQARGVLFAARIEPAGAPKMATAEQMADLSDEPAYFRKRKKDKPQKPLPPVPLQSYHIDFSVPAKQFRSSPAPLAGKPGQIDLEFAAGAYSADGALVNGAIDHAAAPSKTKLRSYMVEQDFLAPADAKFMRVAVRDADTGELGSLEVSLPLAPEPQQASAVSAAGGKR